MIAEILCAAEPGEVFASADFAEAGSADAIRKALSRMVKTGELGHQYVDVIVNRENSPVNSTGIRGCFLLGRGSLIDWKGISGRNGTLSEGTINFTPSREFISKLFEQFGCNSYLN